MGDQGNNESEKEKRKGQKWELHFLWQGGEQWTVRFQREASFISWDALEQNAFFPWDQIGVNKDVTLWNKCFEASEAMT